MQTMAGKLKKIKESDLSKIANTAYSDTLIAFKDKKPSIAISVVCESLFYENESSFVDFYGQNIVHLFGRWFLKFDGKFSDKPHEALNDKIIADSYLFADYLSNAVKNNIMNKPAA